MMILLFSEISSLLVIMASSTNQENSIDADGKGTNHSIESLEEEVPTNLDVEIDHSDVGTDKEHNDDDYLMDTEDIDIQFYEGNYENIEFPDGIHVWSPSNYNELVVNGDEVLEVDDNGIYWLGDAIFSTEGDHNFDPRLDFLLAKPAIKKETSKTVFSSFTDMITSILSVEELNASSNPSIERIRTVQSGLSSVGEYRVNNRLAYCIEHNSPPAQTGSSYTAQTPYRNAEILRALYYGWGGEANIFSSGQQDAGLVVTSLILSRVQNPGDRETGKSLPRYEQLWNLVRNGTNPPSSAISLTRTNLSVSVSGNRQVSQSTRLEAHSSNRIQISVPSKVRIVNETRNTSSTGGTLTIRGGDTFYFSAPLDYNTTLRRSNIKGDLKRYTPMITYHTSGRSQPLIQMRVDDDPKGSVSFTVPFKRQEVGLKVFHRDLHSNTLFDTTTAKRLIGDSYRVSHSLIEGKIGSKKYPLINAGGQTGAKTISANASNNEWTVYYNTRHNHTVQIIDKYSGKLLETSSTRTYSYKQDYSRSFTKNRTYNGTNYVLEDGTIVSGTMGRGDRTDKLLATPYHDITVKWQNRFPSFDVLREIETTQPVGYRYNYTQPLTFPLNDGRVFERENNDVFAGTLGYRDLSHTFLYRLRRDVTVNYIDNRTGEPIRDSKVYTLLQGDTYSEVPAVIEKGEYVYRYIRHDGDPESGVIGTSHLTVNYYYDIPLIKTGLERIQIYTTPASEGLPVIVDLLKENNYADTLQDMGEATVMVNVYKGDTLITGKRYTARSLPEQLTLTIPPEALAVNETAIYTVKLEDFNPNDIRVPAEQAEVDTEGHTAEQGALHAEVAGSDVLRYEGVIKTERMIGEEMEVFRESFAIPLEPIRKMKTGYGFDMPIDLTYQNALGNAPVAFGFALTAPEELVDLSYIDYARQAGSVTVPLDITGQTTLENLTQTNQQFALPEVQVEIQTGHLFSTEQVANGDSRITQSLIDGGRKLYLPIWGYVGDYSVDVTTEVPIGIHQMTVALTYPLEVVGHMYLHIDSETKDKDAIHMEPINQDNPFPLGVPDNWTAEEIVELQNFLTQND